MRMLDGISSAPSGLVAASHRVEASASNVANINSNGSIPASDAAQKRDAYQPVRVEQSSTAETEVTGQVGATQNAQANLKSIQTISDLVKKLYDLPQ